MTIGDLNFKEEDRQTCVRPGFSFRTISISKNYSKLFAKCDRDAGVIIEMEIPDEELDCLCDDSEENDKITE